MFSNFLYFLIALVIYSTAELFEAPVQLDYRGLYYSIVTAGLFALVCHFSFLRLARQRTALSFAGMDHKVTATISRLSVFALVLFAIHIYVYRLNHIMAKLPLFQWVPTLEALVFLGIFLFYLVLIWNAAYKLQQQHFPGILTKKSFVFSNIAFALPALLPWFCLSLFADIIGVLPFAPLKAFFNSTLGEILYILGFLITVAVFGPVLIQRLWGCRSLDPGAAREKIEGVCRMAGLKYNDILKWELFGGTMITAGVMGILGRFRYILVTPALLNALDDDEVEGVMLHEIGHVQRHHMIFYLVFFLGFIACNFVFFEPAFMLLYVAQPLYQGIETLGIAKSTAHPMLICGGLILFFVAYFRFGFGFFMRNFERQADLHIFNFRSSPSALISTFYKIASLSRQSMDTPNWHHYSIGQRIRFLEQCRQTPALIGQHHRRVKRMMAGYLVLVVLVFYAGYSISYGHFREGFEQYIAGKILTQQLDIDPDNSDLYVFVGDYYYNQSAFQKAVNAYENVIRVDGKNIHALNNLAWLLATCPDETFRDPKKSLELASRAKALEQKSYILDTYAEALAMNNRPAEALDVSRKALSLASEKKADYRDQVARFQRLAEGV